MEAQRPVRGRKNTSKFSRSDAGQASSDKKQYWTTAQGSPQRAAKPASTSGFTRQSHASEGSSQQAGAEDEDKQHGMNKGKGKLPSFISKPGKKKK